MKQQQQQRQRPGREFKIFNLVARLSRPFVCLFACFRFLSLFVCAQSHDDDDDDEIEKMPLHLWLNLDPQFKLLLADTARQQAAEIATCQLGAAQSN